MALIEKQSLPCLPRLPTYPAVNSVIGRRNFFQDLCPDSVLCPPCSARCPDDKDKAESSRQSLRGVRFSALSAAGPSGARPEHLRDLLSARSRTATSRMHTATAVMISNGVRETPPDYCRWILDSRLVFLKKKRSETPRPI